MDQSYPGGRVSSRWPLPLVLAAAAAFASFSPPASTTRVADLESLEREALTLKAQGRYREALAACARALNGAVDPAVIRAGAAAVTRGEFLAQTLHLLGGRAGDPEGAADVLKKAAGPELRSASPYLASRMDLLRMQLLLSVRRTPEAIELSRTLGFISEWMVIGPFDNERGGGYRTASPPEKGYEPEGTYEGKKRPVRWRKIEVHGVPGAYVDLDAALRPNDQVLAYASVAVESESDQDAALRLGSDEAVKVWVNGAEVLGRDLRRNFAFDQDTVALRLRKGPNRILLKVCEQDGGFGFAARLTAPGGGPLAGVRTSTDGAALLAANEVSARDGAAAVAERGAEGFADTLLAGTGGDGMDLFRAATCLALAQRDDEGSRRDRELARRAVAARPEDPVVRYLYAFTLLRAVRHDAEKEENARRSEYEKVIGLDPRSAEALRALAEMELDLVGRVGAAEQHLRSALEVNPGFVNATLLRLTCMEKRGMTTEREVLLRKTAARPEAEGNPEVLVRLGDLERDHGRLAAEVEARKQLAGEAFGAASAQMLARALFTAGDAAGAKTVLDEAIAVFPMELEPRAELARQARASGDLAAAIAAWVEWMAVCPEDDEAHLRLAELEGLAGRNDKMLVHLKDAVRLNPNLKDVRRRIEFLESTERPFYEEFLLDARAVLEADAGAPKDSAEHNDSHYYLLRQKVVRAFRDGTSSTYEHVIARVLNERGTRRFDVYTVPHDPEEQDARIIEARVFRKDGTVERARIGHGGSVDLPTLSAGDAVEIAARVDDLKQSFFGDYFGVSHLMQTYDLVPVRDSRLDLWLDGKTTYHFHQKNGVGEPVVSRKEDGSLVHRYRMTDLPRLRVEERRPDPAEFAPIVQVSTYASWNEFSAWWWNLIRKQMEVSPELRSTVRELTAGKQTQEEKIRAIYDFVVTDVRYKAWEFGVHGYKPYNAAAILARRHGDCKDKAILMNTMLAEVGIKAYPVLINAETLRSREDLTLPLVGHFNHCISYLPPDGARPGLFLDGTAQYHDFRSTPEMDRGAEVLIVEPDRAVLLTVPWTDPRENRVEREFVVALDRRGNAEVTVTEQPQGNQAPWVRQRYGNEPGKRQERLEDQYSRMFGRSSVSEFDFGDLNDLNVPVRFRVKLSVKDFVQRQGEDFVLKGAFEPENLGRLASGDSREFDLLLTPPSSASTRIRYQIPDGFDPVSIPEPVLEDNGFGRFEMTWKRSGREVIVSREIVYRVPRIPKEEYPAFRDFAGRVDRAEQQIMILRAAQ